MVRLQFAVELRYNVLSPACDFVFNIHAAHTRSQTVRDERLSIRPWLPYEVQMERAHGSRFVRLHAGAGPLQVSYWASIDVSHHAQRPHTIAEVPVSRLPIGVLPYIYPSRYCQSDQLLQLVAAEFGQLPPGYGRVLAIRDWVRRRVTFQQNSTHSGTSAMDTLNDRVGVCRDFAHLMIALCRALNLPARFATGIDYGADPRLGPSDFHAYVEVYLGNRWYIFDPSGTGIPMGFVRLGTGRDAADAAFATIFGAVESPPPAPRLRIEALADPRDGCVMPVHCSEALSTDDGMPHWL
jgi:transglutaminase-like putative cysteine protease